MIAEELERSHTTIAREVSRFRTRFEYSPSKAHELANRLKPKTGRKPLAKIRPELWEESVRRIILDNSPEQISKSFKLESPDDPSKWISHETIYKYIYATPKGELKLVDFIRQLSGIEVVVSFQEQEDLCVKISLRSKSEFDVQRFAAQFGGGGHSRAAGITINGHLQDVETNLIHALERTLSSQKKT